MRYAKGAITSKIKPAILAQLLHMQLQPSLAFSFSLQLMMAHYDGAPSSAPSLAAS